MPIESGMAPAHALVSFVYVWFNTRTLEAHVRENKKGERRERRDVVRDCAAELVAAEDEDLKVRRERREQPQRLGHRRSCARFASQLASFICLVI